MPSSGQTKIWGNSTSNNDAITSNNSGQVFLSNENQATNARVSNSGEDLLNDTTPEHVVRTDPGNVIEIPSSTLQTTPDRELVGASSIHPYEGSIIQRLVAIITSAFQQLLYGQNAVDTLINGTQNLWQQDLAPGGGEQQRESGLQVQGNSTILMSQIITLLLVSIMLMSGITKLYETISSAHK